MLSLHVCASALRNSLRYSSSLSTAAAEATLAPASLVKLVRAATGAPLLECRAALVAGGAQPSAEAAVAAARGWLRARGVAAAGARSGKVAAQGWVAAAVHSSGRAAALVELACETDFVARTAPFRERAAALAAAAVATLPAGDGAPLVSAVLPRGEGSGGGGGDVAALSAGPAGGSSLTELASSTRENVVLRRVGGLALRPAPTGGLATVVAYLHNSPGDGLGTIGVLLGLRATGAPTAAAPALSALARRLAMHVAAAAPAHATRADVPAASLAAEREALTAAAAASGKTPAIVARMVEGRLAKFYAETVLTDQVYVLDDAGTPVHKFIDAERKRLGVASIEVDGFLRYSLGETANAQAEPKVIV